MGLAPELALNALTGRERAQVLAHLDECPRCREMVCALTSTADELLTLVPEADPPTGFEQRVLAAIMPVAEPVPRRGRWPMATAASLLSLALIGAGWLAGSAVSGSTAQSAAPGARSVLYAPLTNHSQEVGQAYLEPDQPSWVYLSLSANVRTDVNLRCTLTDPDGSSATLGTFALDHGHRAWTIPVSLQRDTKVVATVTDDAGRVIGSANFTPTSSTPPQAEDSTKNTSSDDHKDHKDKDHKDHHKGHHKDHHKKKDKHKKKHDDDDN
ncbi:MAG TPA: zf-HC2 domain-containing protein [Pseudonocardia sp.]|nr:zf-HC2 domain-containing protein [Pseudonocardia sp.]